MMWLRLKGKRKRILLTAVPIVVVIAWVFFYHPRVAVNVAAAWQPDILYRVKTDQQVVALTLDDGPDPGLTPDVLDLLEKHGAKATFFVIGEKVRRHPDLIERIRAGGHEVGNHMMMNFPSFFLNTAEFEKQLVTADSLLNIQGEHKLLRPASGWSRAPQLKKMKEHGYTCCLGSIYPNDPKHHNAKLTEWFVMHKVQAGDIIILHEGKPSRSYVLEALEGILPRLKEMGLEVVSVGEMLRNAE